METQKGGVSNATLCPSNDACSPMMAVIDADILCRRVCPNQVCDRILRKVMLLCKPYVTESVRGF